MKKLKIAAILLSLLCITAFVYADHFKSDEEAYSYGYRAGFNHGVSDVSARLQFDYRRIYTGTNAISFNAYDDDDFQKGYEDGYTDGFYREQRTRVVVSNNPVVVSNNSYDPQSFRNGYREGYYHGLTDRQTGLDYDYKHNHRFESGIAYDSYAGASFQSAYQQGYKQGYYGASVDVSYRPSTNVIPVATTTGSVGFVTAFTDDDFDGEMREFSIGRYSDLDGDWDDSLESIQIHGPVRVILFEDDDFEGKQLVIERTVKDLDDFNFDDKAGSMIVEPLY